MTYGWQYVPGWFVLFAIVIFVLFIVFSHWLTKGKAEATGGDGVIGTKAIYFENPIKIMTRKAEVIDLKTNYVGFVKREFDNVFQMLASLFIPNYFVDVSSEDAYSDVHIRIHKLRERKDLVQSRWEVKLNTYDSEEKFLIKGDKKLISNEILSFSYKEDKFSVTKNADENVVYFYKGGKQIAYISTNGKLPPRRIIIDAQEGSDLPILLLASIFELIKFYK
ncbi:tubby C-terminal domain-like protein [Halobacillus sp. B29]|uniref:tubby C-terminal domain-like protein n=1 Tax=Halobacillus sp. B29 TaxID=3457432 RepID=UPI003FCC52FF